MLESAAITLTGWGSLDNILLALWRIVEQLFNIVVEIGGLAFTAPVMPLLIWSGFWLFAVDWTRLRQVMLRGGWIGVLLIGVVMVVAWQQISPQAADSVLGLMNLNGYIEKLMYVTGLVSLMFICGAVQLTGCCGRNPATVTEAAEPGEGNGH